MTMTTLHRSPRLIAGSLKALLTISLLLPGNPFPRPNPRAADWPQYRGPNGDGSSPEAIQTDWTIPPRVLWRRPIGQGWSSIVGQNQRLFTMEKRTVSGQEREFAVAYNAQTGAELWAADLDAAVYSSLVGYDDRIDGPRSTPAIAGDRLIAATSHLKVFCLALDTGELLWTRDFAAELRGRVIAWENAASPLVVGDLAFFNANSSQHRLIALRIADGSTAWSVPSSEHQLTHATPVFARIENVPQILFLTLTGLISVVPETGAILWRMPFQASGTSTAPTPLVVGNTVHASSAYSEGRTWLTEISRAGTEFSARLRVTQPGNTYRIHWSSPVAHDQFAYAIPSPSASQGRLACLDLAAGTNRWTQTIVGSNPIRFGSLIKTANTLLVLSESGELVLVEPNPSQYTERGRFQLLENYCWNHPALINGHLYARNSSLAPELVALDLSLPARPLPPLQLSADLPPARETFRLLVRTLEGPLLDPAQAANLEILATDNITSNPASWTPLDLPLQPNPALNAWILEIPWAAAGAQYFRLRPKNAPLP